MLPPADVEYLTRRWPDHTLKQDGGMVAVLLPGFELPAGFEPRRVDLLLRLQVGYPIVQPDMFWVDPAVTLHGRAPVASGSREVYLGRTWQRFSRHLQSGAWRPDYGVRNYLALVVSDLGREARSERQAA
jgi:hypothetical protein